MLAINTAFINANLALETTTATILKDIDSRSKHSENVLKTIDDMCQEAKIDILDVKKVGVVVGPGSFTGLRIGVAIAKALACVNPDLKIVSISSLELMAYNVVKQKLCNGDFVCALNGLSDLFFVANFDKNGNKTKNERMISRKEFESLNNPIFALENDIDLDNVKNIEITSKILLEFMKNKDNQGCYVNLEDLEPMYLRLSQAEDNLLKKNNKI